MLFKVAFRCMFLAKNMGDPYYEPTIVVHDTMSTETYHTKRYWNMLTDNLGISTLRWVLARKLNNAIILPKQLQERNLFIVS